MQLTTTAAPPRWHGVAIFGCLSTLYFAVGAVLSLRYNLFDPDAPSRVANAGYAVLSRHPHLSAIGFVWNPLPSLVEMPFIPLHRFWPELKTYGLAGAVQSAVFMAAAALMIRRIALDRGLGTGWRWVVVGAFALNPVIVIYGGSGMSEAAELFAILWCVRYLLRWVDSHQVGDLAWAGIALGVGYLARYEMIPAACGVAALVAVVTFVRAPRQTRLPSTVVSVVLVLFPIWAAFVIWAVTGWVVSGEAFPQLSSQYGNDSQVAGALARGGTAHSGSADVALIAARMLAMQPLAGIAAVVAAVLALLTRKVDGLVAVVTFGAVLAFSAWGQFSETTFGLFRYYLPAIPMVLVIAMTCWRVSPAWWPKVGAALLCGSLLVAIPVTTTSMLDEDIGNQPLQFGLKSLIDPVAYPAEQQRYRRELVDDRLLAEFLDRKELPDGSVLMDTFFGWGIWLASDDPTQFVVTSDYDFTAALNRPWDFGIRYIVVNNPGLSDADAVHVRYPAMWDDGAGFGTLVYSARGPGGDEDRRRVYRIDGPPMPEPAGSAQLAQPGG